MKTENYSALRNIFTFKSGKSFIISNLMVLFFGMSYSAQSQAEAFIASDGETTICQSQSTTIQVIIGASQGPYTVVYSNGSANFTVNNYNSIGDPESPSYGGDPITVSPTVTTTYSLVSVHDAWNNALPINSGVTVTITVNPLPSNISVSPSTRVCPGVDFTISATATNGSTFELWNAANTSKIADLPYTTSITSNTNYTVRAISGTTPACTTSTSYSVLLENTPPSITCPGNQTLNPASGCSASLPDYRGLVTVSDNCTANGSITLSQSPSIGTSISGHNTTQLVTITATDEAGNSSNCSFNVTLIDNINPSITCVGNKTVPASANCTYTHLDNTWNPLSGVSATDNCVVSSIIYQLSGATEVPFNAANTSLNGVTFQPGTTTVTWRVTDSAGNMANCSFTVSIDDTQNPTVTCPGNQAANTSAGICTYTNIGTDWNVSAADNCTVASISYVLSGATEGTYNSTLNNVVFNKGTTTVNVTVLDGASPANSASCSFTVNITDNQDPGITCPDDIIEEVVAGCSKSINIPAILFNDNCPGSTIAWSTSGATNLSGSGQPGTQIFNSGLTMVTVTVTDASGRTAECSFSVTLSDNILPTVTCPGNISVNTDNDVCNALVTIPAIVFGDNCSGSSLAWSLSGSTTLNGSGQPGQQTFAKGLTTVTLTVTDAVNNTAQCSFTVTVTDSQLPEISCPGNVNLTNDPGSCNRSYTVPVVTFTDNCPDPALSWVLSGATSGSGTGYIGTRTFNVGVTNVSYTVTDGAGLTAQCSFTITVTDTQKPVISGCPSNINRTSGAGQCSANVSWTEPVATDNCTSSGNLVWTKSHTPGTSFPVGTTTVTYTVRDAAGNVSDVCSFNVIVTDNQKPVITGCPSNMVINVAAGQCSATATWTEPTATDNCTPSGSLIWTKSHTPGATFNAGTTTVTYSVADGNGNTSNTCSFTVTVVDNIAPTALCKPATIYLNSSGTATLAVVDVNNGSSDNCTPEGGLVKTLSKTNFNCSNLGANTVTLTIRDLAGNTGTCTATVTVIDNIPPTLTSTSGTVTSNINSNTGSCTYTITGSEFDPVTADNCSGVIKSYNVTGATTLSGSGSLSGKILNAGANLITWTALDASGNPASTPLSFTKTVIDNQIPVITGKSNQTRSTDPGLCTYTAVGNEFDITYSDNCNIASVTYKIGAGTPVEATTMAGVALPVGVNLIEWTVSDGSNSRSTSFRVTVEEDEPPVITSIDDILLPVDEGECSAVVTWAEPTVTDNCGDYTLTRIAGPPSGSTFALGTTLIRYRAEDTAGNFSIMEFEVVVSIDEAPTVNCPLNGGLPSSESNPFIRNADAGVCFYTILEGECTPVITTSSGCTVTATNSFDGTNTLNGKQLPVGNHEIVWTATDGFNSSSCTIYVNVIDNQSPQYTLPAGNTPKLADPGTCYFAVPGVEFDPAGLSDNCGIATSTYVVTKNGITTHTGSGTLSGVQLTADQTFPYVITWTVTDIHGNTVIGTPFSVTVSDNQAPLYVCSGNVIREKNYGDCQYQVSGTEFDPINLVDNCDPVGNLTISYTINGVLGAGTTLDDVILDAGVHTIIWTIKDTWNNSTNCVFTITVKDLVDPIITAIADQTREAPASTCYYVAVGGEFNPSASDNCNLPTLTNNLNGTNSLDGYQFPVGKTVVVWTARDASDNMTTMEFEVTVLDVTPPDYTLTATVDRNASATGCYYAAIGNEFDPQNISDACTPDNFYVNNPYNDYSSLAYEQFPVGSTTVEWTVRDFHGNEQKKSITINVTDITPPVINCPTNDYVRIVDSGQNYYTVGVNEFKPVTTDNCGVVTYVHNYGPQADKTTLNGVQLPEGSYTITWTATDAANNVTTCAVNIHVVTSLHPPITCVGDQIKDNTTGDCSYTVSGNGFNATSTSGAATLTHDVQTVNSGILPYSPNSNTLDGAEFPVGEQLVTWTASQTISGTVYTSTCSFWVTVVDNEDPVITPAATVNVNTNSGCYASGVNLGTPVVTDNCGIFNYWNNAPTYYPRNSTTVTWWVEDIYGNISSAEQEVVVADDDPPTFSCVGSLCRQVDEGQTYYTVNGHEFNPYGVYDCSGIKSITNDFDGNASLDGAQIPTTTTSITWTVTDNADNVSTCTINISILSSDPPSVTCRGNETRPTDAGTCTYIISGTEFDISSTTTPTPTITYTLSGATTGSGGSTLSGVTLNRGLTTVTWKAVSGTEENECCVFTINVYDNQNPSVTWPENVSVNVDVGGCTATNVNLGTPTATDNCDDDEVIVFTRTPSGNTFQIGTTSVYWRATDIRGNVSTHTQTVTVVDNIAPVIACPTERYYREFNNSSVSYYTITGTEFRPGRSDNCTIASYTNNIPGWTTSTLNGHNLAIGDHAIVWTATDGSANTAECTVNVTVVDSFEPILNCPDDVTFYSPADQCDYTVSGTAIDPSWQNQSVIAGRTLTHNIQTGNSAIVPYALSSTTLAGAVFPKGVTSVTWTASQTIGGITYTTTCEYNIEVIDNTPPVITPPADISIDNTPGFCYNNSLVLDPLVVTDNCTTYGNLTIINNRPVNFLVGTTNVRWTVTDESGNFSIYVQEVTVMDNEGPEISNCPTEPITAQSIGASCQAVVSWPPLIATDACSGVLSFVTSHSPGSLFPVGTTEVTYTAIDNEGNISTCTFDVIVTDIPPVITCVSDQTRSTNSGVCSYKTLGNEFDPLVFSDNCAVASLSWSFYDKVEEEVVTGFNTLSGVVIPRGFGLGETGIVTITWTATDVKGNTTNCEFDLTIQDLEGPKIIVPGNAIRYTDSYTNTYTVNGTEFDDVIATDNCGIVVKLENHYNSSTLADKTLNVGLNIISWYAEDDKGNHNTELFYVTILDNLDPRLQDAETGTTVNAGEECEIAVNYTPPVFEDNVTGVPPNIGSLSITISPDWAVPGAIFPVGVTEVTYMVVDEAGNNFAYTFDVTVLDETLPVITCPAGSPFTRQSDPGEAYYTVNANEFNAAATDNCEVNLTNNLDFSSNLSGDHIQIGEHTITWTATDASGNVSTCQIEVDVEDNEDPVIAECPSSSVDRVADLNFCRYRVAGAEYDPFGFTDNHQLQKITYQIDMDAPVGNDLTTSLAGVDIPVGEHTITWTLYDVSGNITTCVIDFDVIDTQPPVIVIADNQNRTVDAGEANYTIIEDIPGNSWNPVVTDNCAVQLITYKINDEDPVGTGTGTSILGEELPVGTHDIIWEATDIYGHKSTGVYTVIVTDNEPPTVNCNDITVELNSNGLYTLTEDDKEAIGAGSSDPSGDVIFTVSPDVFECIDVGENDVTLTVTDIYGNSATCDAVVTVEDNIAPAAICKNILLPLDVLGQATLTASDINNGSADACGIASLSVDKTNFTCSDFGVNTITLTVTDNNGNSSICTSEVTIEDDLTPSAVCNPITIYLDDNGNYLLGIDDVNAISLGSTDNCSLIRSVVPNTFNCNDIGSNEVTLTVTDPSANSDVCTTTINVVDNEPPVAICKNITEVLDALGTASILPGDINNNSTDACGIFSLSASKTDFTCADLGDNNVTLTLTDNNGNSSTCLAIVTIVDDIDPGVICTGNKTVNTDLDECSYQHSGTGWDASANDVCTTIASLTYALSGATEVVSNPLNTSLNNVEFNKGVTTVNWTAVDGSGNSSNCSFTVTVEDNQDPEAICQNLTIQLDVTGEATITPAQVDNGSNDNCTDISLSLDQSTFDCNDLGVNSVTLTVTDGSLNTSTCLANITVEDIIPPVAVCQDITVQLDVSGEVTVPGNQVNDGSTDNTSCLLTYLVSKTSDGIYTENIEYHCGEVGIRTLYMKVRDLAGNLSTDYCSATITVEDNVDPDALCKNITVQLDVTGNASITASQIDNVSTDACGIFSLSASKTAFSCADIGENTVTLTVTDVNGNISTCDALVTIEDEVNPVFTSCPGNKTEVTDNDLCTYEHPDDTWDPVVGDNCGVSTLIYTVSAPSTLTAPNTTLEDQIFAKGITTVTWTATDASGNSETCVFTVNINDEQDPEALCKTYTAQLQRNGEAIVTPVQIDNASYDNCGIVTYEISKDNTNWASSVTYNCSEIGTPTAYLRVTDAAGNSDVCSHQISVVDQQAPALDAEDIADLEKETDNNVCTYTHTDNQWNPTDNCDPAPTITYTLSGSTTVVTPPNTTLNGQVFNQGSTTVTWTVADASGNNGIVEFVVVVIDEEDPTITCPANITQSVADPGDLDAIVSLIPNPDYDDNCAVTMLTYAFSGATTSNHQLSGINLLNEATFNVGTTTISYIAYDAAGNSHNCNFTITVNALPLDAVIVAGGPITTYEDQAHGPATFTVKLPAAPTGDVCIDVKSLATSEGLVNTANNRAGAAETKMICFNESNWNVEQTIYVFGVDDLVDEVVDNNPYTIELTINQANTDLGSGFYYADPEDVDATHVDNDIAGITVVPIDTETTEAGGTGTFTVVLDTEPTHDVTITLSSNDLTEGDITDPVTKTLTFTPANWNIPQLVTVTGIDEEIVDGDESYDIVTSASSSTDPQYHNLVVDDVTMINLDNDVPGFIVTPLTLVTTEHATTPTTATFTVRLTSKPATDTQDFEVVVNVVSGDLTEGTVDLSTLTFTAANWDIPQTVTVTSVDDIVVDGNITYTITLSTDRDELETTDPVYRDLSTEDPDNVSVTNNDNDAATVSINNVSLPEGTSGTTTPFSFVVTHSGQEVIGGYSVTWYTTPGTARAPSDFTGAGGTINFDGSVGETETITILINHDNMVEPNEIFTVVLNTVNAGGKNVTIPLAGKNGTGTIQNDDASSLSINDVSIVEGNSGTQTLTFTVTLTNPVELGVKVDYTTQNVTALSGEDYVGTSGTLTFIGNAGETKTINVTIPGDIKVEMDETFNVILSNIRLGNDNTDANLSISDATGVGTITNDDSATLSIDNVTLSEGHAGNTNFEFTVTMSQLSDAIVTVDYATVDGTATSADSDYNPVSGTLTFNPGESTKTITVPVNGDSKVELNEAFTVVLSNLVNNGRNISIHPANHTGTGTITNDDGATLAINDVSIAETDAGTTTLEFTVTHSGDPVDTGFSVDFATQNSTATVIDGDYVSQTGTLNFSGATGETHSISITINGDEKVELDETFNILLSNIQAGGRNVTFTKHTGMGTIENDDAAEISINNVTLNEGHAGNTNFEFTVSMTYASDAIVAVNYTTANITATTIDNDYTLTSGMLTFNPGEVTKTVSVPVIGDNTVELDETFSVNLSGLVNNGRAITILDGNGLGTILNDDQAVVAITDVSEFETNSGQTTFRFTVTLSTDSDATTTIDYTTVDGTALVADDDYEFQSGTLTFLPGETVKYIDVLVNGDLKVELDETFSISLSNLVEDGRNVVMPETVGSGTINNDDSATISINDLSIDEDHSGTTEFTFTVTMSTTSDVAVSFNYVLANGTALVGDSDYQMISGSLTFDPGQTEKTITVLVNGDIKVELDETFAVNLSDLDNDGRDIDFGKFIGVGSIMNDDNAEIMITDVIHNEPNPGYTQEYIFTVTHSSSSVDSPFTVNFETVDVTATAGSDYISSTGTLTFSGATGESHTITIVVNGDHIVEPTELFHVLLTEGDFLGKDIFITKDTGVGAITDYDVTNVSIVATNHGAEPGTNGLFTVSMPFPSESDTEISYTVTGTATPGADYTSLSGTIIIPAGLLTATIPVPVMDDDLFEETETVIVTLQSIVSGESYVFIGSPNTATVNITNDDDEATAFAGDDAAICSSTASYTIADATATDADTYSWVTSGTGSFGATGNTLNATYTPSTNDINAGQVTLTLTVSGNGGTATDEMILTIWAAATVYAGPNATICSGNSYVITAATASDYETITWSSTGGTFNNANALNPTFTPSTTGNITLTLTATGLGNCPDAVSSMILTVNQSPTLTASGIVNTQCNASVGQVVLS
ncbi:MAG TPA: HYR domain-containing protein, partial [Saprospiraceae bacterium]|nr:HYR domain-containing protein [Saprospiraceae bacterium]